MRKRNYEKLEKTGRGIAIRNSAAAFDSGDIMALMDYIDQTSDDNLSWKGKAWKCFDIGMAVGYHLAQLEAKRQPK